MSDATLTENQVNSDNTDEMTKGAKLDLAVKAAIDAVVAEEPDFAPYKSLPVAGRNRVKKAVVARSRATLAKADPTNPEAALADMMEAKRLDALEVTLKGMTGAAPKKAPANPLVTLGDRIATLRLAADLLEEGAFAPNGLDAQIVPVQASLLGSANVTEAVRLAISPVSRKSPTNDVGAAIRDAFEDLESGAFLTTGEICQHWEDNGGPKKSDSSGRVGARLFPRKDKPCTVAGIVPGTHPDHGGQGAFKA